MNEIVDLFKTASVLYMGMMVVAFVFAMFWMTIIFKQLFWDK